MPSGFLGLPWFWWAAIALAVAVTFSVVRPRRPAGPGLIRHLVLRWGHAVTWLLLSLSFLIRGASPTLSGAANAIALAGGATYGVFLMTLVTTR